MITLDNVTSNSAIAFDLEINYQNGQLYRSICDLIGGEPSGFLQSNYETDSFPKQGVFNANSQKQLPITTNLEFIIKGICYRLSDHTVDEKNRALRYNNFIRKTYKIAEMKMDIKDITGQTNSSVYDIQLSICHLISCKADYAIDLTFVMQEKQKRLSNG